MEGNSPFLKQGNEPSIIAYGSATEPDAGVKHRSFAISNDRQMMLYPPSW